MGMLEFIQRQIRIAFHQSAKADEGRRAASLIADASAYERAEADRARAEIEVSEGVYVNLTDTVVPPTPELLAKGNFIPFTPKGEDGTVRSVKTVRRYIHDPLLTLHARGVLDDDTFAACRWYRDRYEAAEMEPSCAVASYGESVRGDPAYGHLPRSQWAAEARSDFRWATGFIPVDVADLFMAVALHDMSISDAARAKRCRYANAAAAFRRGALALHDGIAHRLPNDAPAIDQ